MSEKSMEFIWKTDPVLKVNNYLFTGITPFGYYPPDGVCLNCFYRPKRSEYDQRSKEGR